VILWSGIFSLFLGYGVNEKTEFRLKTLHENITIYHNNFDPIFSVLLPYFFNRHVFFQFFFAKNLSEQQIIVLF